MLECKKYFFTIFKLSNQVSINSICKDLLVMKKRVYKLETFKFKVDLNLSYMMLLDSREYIKWDIKQESVKPLVILVLAVGVFRCQGNDQQCSTQCSKWVTFLLWGRNNLKWSFAMWP